MSSRSHIRYVLMEPDLVIGWTSPPHPLNTPPVALGHERNQAAATGVDAQNASAKRCKAPVAGVDTRKDGLEGASSENAREIGGHGSSTP